MTKLLHVLLALSYLATISSADYIRFSIREIISIEPREWSIDHLWGSLNLVTTNQNVTQRYKFDDWPRARHTTPEDVYKDVTITGNEPDLTLSFAIYNVGDDEPQEVGLRITSLILSIPSRIPGAGGIAAAVKLVIDMFTGSYKCEGPVAVTVSQISQQYMRDMAYNNTLCKMEDFSYPTQKGCVDVNPFSTKETKYKVRHCIEKFEGTSTASGGTPLKNEGGGARYGRFGFGFGFGVAGLGAAFGVVVILMGVL